jgi:hypothetical protein
VRLVKQAWRDGFRDLACIIAIIWDTQFQPGDVRSLAARHRHVQDDRLVLNRLDEGRQKTGKPIVGILSRRTEWLGQNPPVKQVGDAEFIRTRSCSELGKGAPTVRISSARRALTYLLISRNVEQIIRAFPLSILVVPQIRGQGADTFVDFHRVGERSWRVGSILRVQPFARRYSRPRLRTRKNS